MTPPELIRLLHERGVHIGRTETGQIRLRCNPAALPPDLLEAVKLHKTELVDYLRVISSLKIGMKIQSPFGVGRVWELYPVNDRCGILIDGETTPRFFSIMDAIAQNFTLRRSH